jgi:T5SS/PEP-CTERM-associated repeat protein
MKRTFLALLSILVGSHAAFVQAQSPEACESVLGLSVYRGSYSGDFSGEVTGQFVLGADACNPPAIGRVNAFFKGPLAEYWNTGSITGSACAFSGGSFASPFEPFRIQGAMEFGTCTVSGTWTATLPWDAQNPRSGEFTMSRETLTPVKVIWNALNGDFHDSANWGPPVVPGTGQTAAFRKLEPFAVSFGTPASSGRFLIEAGDVSFLTGSYTAVEGSETEPSAVIGNSDWAAILHLASHNLTTNFSTLALTSISPAEVFVENGSTWTEQGRMVVGKAGLAYLHIQDNATVTSLETQIGAEASGDGTVNVAQTVQSTSQTTEWNTGRIAIGLSGQGTVNHFGGNMISPFAVLGVNSGAQGTVTVGSATATASWILSGPLAVGDHGEGLLMIVDGGVVFVNAETQVVVGQSEGGFGTARINGARSELFAPGSFVIVGANGSGSMSLRNGGIVTCKWGIVDSDGIVLIDNAKWICTDFSINDAGSAVLNNGLIEADEILNIQPGGTVEGNGHITTPDANIEGNVAPGVVISATKGLTDQNESIGTLTFGGNVTFGSATLEIDMGGLAEGSYDVLHATGAVNIQDATIHFSFINGFLPHTGDTVPFLLADGGITAANLKLEFEGVKEGFQFELVQESGKMVFHALNDAQPIVVEPTPVPTAMNPQADVNRDNVIDAGDLLEVLSNWHHVVPH